MVMDRKLLTVLGCSSSIALTLLSTNPAKASSATEYVLPHQSMIVV